MTKLDRLKKELSRLELFYCLPPQMKQTLEIYYKREIDAIEKYGAENSDFKIPRRKKEE